MPIQNLPESLQPAIQQGFLEREFHDGLKSVLSFRSIADREAVAVGNGETITKTRTGLKAPVEKPLDPASNTNLDNGLKSSAWTVEQYTLAIDQYADTQDLNVVTSKVAIADVFLRNARINGIQAAQSLDRLARNALFNAYIGGQTRVRKAQNATPATLAVDDVRGFEQVLVRGSMQAVSSSASASVRVGNNTYTLIGVTRDDKNASTAPNGISGSLLFSSEISKEDSAENNAIIHENAPTLLRPNGRDKTSGLTKTDTFLLATILDAQAALRNNTAMVGETFKLFLDNQSMRQLFADDDFKHLYQGQYGSEAYQQGRIIHLLGIDFIPTTEAYVQTLNGVKIRRPILVAPGALVEGDFAGMEAALNEVSTNSEIHFVDGIAQVTRGALDRLQQIIAQSWYWIGGFAAPSDITANQTIIPTANNAYFKRAVVIEHAG